MSGANRSVQALWKDVQVMLAMSGEELDVPVPGKVEVLTNGDSEHLQTPDDVLIFKACADKGRKKSLRSLEIPLDNLLSGIIYTAGGRDKRGGPVLLLTQPSHLELDTLIEITDQDFFDMLAYFTSVPSDECRQLKFSVVIDGEVIHDFLLRIMIRGLATIHSEENLLHKVFFVSSVRDITRIDWKTEYCAGRDVADLPFQQVGSHARLLKYFDRNQLTSEFGGTLQYNHHDWVRFRMQVEPFLCDCISISKRLARAVEPFTEEAEPESIEAAEESLQRHHLIRRKTLEVLHIDELESEGSRIDKHMHATASPHLSSNPDFSSTLDTISTLLTQIGNVKGRVEELWSTRNLKLQTSIKQKKFEKEASKVIEWFEEYAEEFFQTHTELGDSFEVAQALTQEVNQFEEATKQIVLSSSQLLSSGEELEQLPYSDQATVGPLMGKIKQLVTDFDSRLSKRKKKLDDSVKLHRLTAAALDWCIESTAVLSGSDLLSSQPEEVDSEQMMMEVEQFLATYPPPTDHDVQMLHDLTEAMESQWIKDNALFAYNRVVEVKERFTYYRKHLEELLAEHQRQETLRHEQERDQQGTGGKKEVRIAEALLTQLSMDGEEEPDGVLLENKTIAHTEGTVQLRHPKTQTFSNSLMYDDSGVGHAMMLLKSVVKSADAKLNGAEDDGVDGRSASPHISKQDISNPTRTHGPLFKTGTTFDSDEEDNLTGMTTVDQRAKILELPCPVEDSLKNQTKHARHRRKLMEELIQTEETYIRDMQWVVDKYMPAMDDISRVPRNLVGKKNFIFSTLPQLLQFNRIVILPQLKILSKCPVKLGQFFMTLEEDLLNYSLYFKNLPQQTQLMEEGGLEFFNTISHEIGDRFLLNSYLIKPFQRITKYKIFLEEMIKHSSRGDLKGKLKEYHEKLKEAQKMVDFILRHGNDLLAVECLRGYEGSMREHGKILRQGDLVLVEYTKHHRRMFLFEHAIILAKKRKPKHQLHDVAGSEIFDFKNEYKTSDFGLRENVDGHPTRFQLYKKKDTLTFQAEGVEEKNTWVQDIWDLFFSHMLNLKDKNLEAHGSHALTSIAASGSATIGRSFGHTLRRAVSVRRSVRYTKESGGRVNGSRPSSIQSINSRRHSGGTLSEESHSPSTFVDLRPRSGYDQDSISPRPHSGYDQDSASNRSSIVSSSSVSTISSWNPGMPTPGMALQAPSPATEKPHHLSSVYRVSSAESPKRTMYKESSPRPSSSASSLHSPVLTRKGSPRPSSSASSRHSPMTTTAGSPRPSSAGSAHMGGKSPQPQGPASPQLSGRMSPLNSSSSSLDSLEKTLNPLMYDTPV